MQGEDRERVVWIDVARGIGIVIVVAGHVFTAADVHRVIFLFHMPFFFFLSGWVFRPTQDLAGFARKRLMALALPYAAFLVSVALIDTLLSLFDHVVTVRLWSKGSLRLLLGGSMLHGAEGVFWFVPCLLFVSLLYAVLRSRLGKPSRPAMLAALACAYAIALFMPHGQTPLGIGQVPLALAFFGVGALCAERNLPPAAWLAGLMVFGVAAPWAPLFDMKLMIFGTPGWSFLVALAGTFGLIAISRGVARVPGLSAAAELLGRASLVIMFLHLLVVMHLRGRFPDALVFVAATAVPLAIYVLLERFEGTRVVFIGRSTRLARRRASPIEARRASA
jgi:fucose 4-O-acetylase-like acetyltransferase